MASTYRHSMMCHTDGIRAIAPVKWRGFDGSVSVFWEAEAESGATGYYLSPDPRIVIFFNDVSSHIRMSNRNGVFEEQYRPIARAIYVPAGVPMWTNFTAPHRFSHLDLHLHKDRLLKFLSPCIGTGRARKALHSPVEVQDADGIAILAGLLVGEVSRPSRHAIYAESLVGSIVAGLLDIPENDVEQTSGRLTQGQMNKLVARLDSCSDCRLSVAEMAATVGLSESWFANVFKQTTGKTPLQWQLSTRIDRAKDLLMDTELTLADIAAQLGFSDQAHLTKAFGQIAGETPAAWRRLQLIR